MGTSIADNDTGPGTSGPTDAELVAASLGGDRQALGVIYDTYADRIHTMCVHMLGDREEAADVCGDVFLIAFQRLGQLRDPERLRPWLYAICRHEVFRRTKRRNRTILVEEVSEMDRIADHDDEVDTADAAGLALLVQEAAAGLDDRDRLVLELQLQGLEGDDLAAALGTSTSTSYQHVHRMRERMGRSVGALLVARRGRADCAELDRLLAEWDGRFGVLWRKRIARHVDGCDVCERRRAAVPTALFGVAGASPLVVTPTSVRTRVLDAAIVGQGRGPGSRGRGGWRRDGFPPGSGDGRRRTVAALVGAVLLLVIAALIWVAVTDDPMAIATTDGTGSPSSTSTTTSDETAVPTTAPPIVAPPTVAPTTAPVPTTAVAVSPTTASAPTTSVPTRPATTLAPTVTSPPSTTTAPSTSTTTTTTAVPPTLRLAGPSVSYARVRDGAVCSNERFVATITSSAAPDSVTLRWTAGAATGTVAMTRNRTRNLWSATVDLPFGTTAPVTVVADATSGGATGRSNTLTSTAAPCPVIG